MNSYELDLQYAIDGIMKEWRTDEIKELVTECILINCNNQKSVKKLEEKGIFKRFWRFITGVTKRTKEQLLKDLHIVQDITVQVILILIGRIDGLAVEVFKIIDKQDELYERLFDLDNWVRLNYSKLDQKCNLNSYLTCIRNESLDDGRRYVDLEIEEVILYVASDLFEITRGLDLVKEKEVNQAIDNLEIDRDAVVQVGSFKTLFDRDRGIRNCLFKECIDFRMDDTMLDLERSIYNLAEGRDVDNWIMEIKIPSGELCYKLFKNLQRQYSETIAIKIAELRPSNCIDEKEEVEICEIEQEPSVDRLLVMSPECHEYYDKNGFERDCRTAHKSYNDYKMDINDRHLQEVGDVLVVIPGHYNYANDVQTNVGSNNIEFYNLSDYYFYLWYKNTSVELRKKKCVLFMGYIFENSRAKRCEYKNGRNHFGKLFVDIYMLDSEGNRVNKCIYNNWLPHRSGGKKIQSSIKKWIGENIDECNIIKYRYFNTDYRYVKQNTERAGFRDIDCNWNSIITKDNVQDICKELLEFSCKICEHERLDEAI